MKLTSLFKHTRSLIFVLSICALLLSATLAHAQAGRTIAFIYVDNDKSIIEIKRNGDGQAMVYGRDAASSESTGAPVSIEDFLHKRGGDISNLKTPAASKFLSHAYQEYYNQKGLNYTVLTGYIDDEVVGINDDATNFIENNSFIFYDLRPDIQDNDFYTIVKDGEGNIFAIQEEDAGQTVSGPDKERSPISLQELINDPSKYGLTDNPTTRRYIQQAAAEGADAESILKNLYGGGDGDENIIEAAYNDVLNQTTIKGNQLIGKIATELSYWIGFSILKIASLFLFLSGIFLNWIVHITVAKSAGFFTNDAVTTAWTAFRDLANITFIFILLYISIRTILGGTQFNTKELLGKVIFTALILNFSMFATKVVIDVSNTLALSFFSQIQITGKTSVEGNATNKLSELNGGLSGAFAEPMQLETIYNAAQEKDSNITGDALQFLILSVMGTILMTVLAIVFMVMTIMLVVRLIMLVLYLITSPIAFAGGILPNTQGFSRQWWSGLVGQAFVAPVFFIFCWVILRMLHSDFMTDILAKTSDTNWINVFFGGNKIDVEKAASLIYVYVISIGLAIAAVVASIKTASKSGPMAVNITKRIGSFAGGAILGNSARVMRGTVGRVAAHMEQNIDGRNWASRLVRRGASRVAGSTLDVRATRALSSVLGATGAGADALGQASQGGGFRDRVQRAEQARREEASRIRGANAADTEARRASYLTGPLANMTAGGRNVRRGIQAAREEHAEHVQAVNNLRQQLNTDNAGLNQTVQNSQQEVDRLQDLVRRTSDPAVRAGHIQTLAAARQDLERARKAVENRKKEYEDEVKALEEELRFSTSSRTQTDGSPPTVSTRRTRTMQYAEAGQQDRNSRSNN